MIAGRDPEDDPPEPRSPGYGRPPPEHQFKKGKSGNPRGRPRKKVVATVDPILDQHIGDMILFEALRPVQIKENGQVVELPMAQAIIRSLHVSALKGSHRASVVVTNMLKATQDKVLDSRQAVYTAAMEYKRDYREIFAECDRLGKPRPEPVPHPDEVVIDEQTLQVRYNGPSTHDEKARWDQLLERKREFQEERDYLRAKLKRPSKLSDFYEDELKHADHIVQLIENTIPDEKTRRAPSFDIREWRRQRKNPALRNSKSG